ARDGARARQLFRRGCALKDQQSCHSYATLLATGSGGTRDTRQALQLLERTCSTGYAPACADAKRLRPQVR
ncbi:MAG TPA: hypothetical protein VEX18_11745, partial [Polyangiaceae bacterium]|nr:hypothetical protein [Polyangiaceae bacterium]